MLNLRMAKSMATLDMHEEELIAKQNVDYVKDLSEERFLLKKYIDIEDDFLFDVFYFNYYLLIYQAYLPSCKISSQQLESFRWFLLEALNQDMPDKDLVASELVLNTFRLLSHLCSNKDRSLEYIRTDATSLAKAYSYYISKKDKFRQTKMTLRALKEISQEYFIDKNKNIDTDKDKKVLKRQRELFYVAKSSMLKKFSFMEKIVWYVTEIINGDGKFEVIAISRVSKLIRLSGLGLLILFISMYLFMER